MLIVCIVLVAIALFYWKNKHKEEEEEEIPNEIRYGPGIWCLETPDQPAKAAASRKASRIPTFHNP